MKNRSKVKTLTTRISTGTFDGPYRRRRGQGTFLIGNMWEISESVALGTRLHAALDEVADADGCVQPALVR